MWKLIKAELNYLKPWILGVSGFFILVSLIIAGRTNIENASRMMNESPTIPVFVAIASLVFIFATLYLEINENRLRQQATLPVPARRIGEARITVPAVLFLIFFSLASITIIIMLIKFAALIPDFNAKASVLLSLEPVIPIIIAYLIAIWITVVYGFRLFSEWHGRLLLGVMLGFWIFQAVMSNFFWRFYNEVWMEWIIYWLDPPLGFVTFALMLIFFVLVIHVSFLKRRSFLA